MFRKTLKNVLRNRQIRDDIKVLGCDSLNRMIKPRSDVVRHTTMAVNYNFFPNTLRAIDNYRKVNAQTPPFHDFDKMVRGKKMIILQ